jgi:hypothetical protein
MLTLFVLAILYRALSEWRVRRGVPGAVPTAVSA